MLSEAKKSSGLGISISNMYHMLACIEENRMTRESLHHYKKAKEALINAHLPESNCTIQDFERHIGRLENIVRYLGDKDCPKKYRVLKK
jgi:hypothetical protein